jgi:uncharacterized membrane protein YphA (DoxX/SURF4 family)
MKYADNIKSGIVIFVSYSYALLFIYAASSKLLDYQNFQIQLGQSPLLSAFAGSVALAVPITEILIALLLFIPKYRLIGLFAAFSLMTMFTAYIYIILNYSSFVPCSCGGVLQKMTWDQHLIFNEAFLILAALAILIKPAQLKDEQKKTL